MSGTCLNQSEDVKIKKMNSNMNYGYNPIEHDSNSDPSSAKARGIYQNCLQSLVLNVRAEINKIELKLLELVLNSSLDIVGEKLNLCRISYQLIERPIANHRCIQEGRGCMYLDNFIRDPRPGDVKPRCVSAVWMWTFLYLGWAERLSLLSAVLIVCQEMLG